MQITTIGLDIAKNVFQVHGIDAAEKVVVRKQLRRSQIPGFFKALPACLVGMEACATSHYWARELTKLGHEVRLMPAKDVKAYVKRNKNDAADAEAICEAVRRPDRDRRLGKPVKGHAILERMLLVGTRSADHIRASSHSGCIATGQASTRKTGRIHGCTRTLRRKPDSSCTAGAVHTWPLAVISLRRTIMSLLE